jgi:hypothetical protein
MGLPAAPDGGALGRQIRRLGGPEPIPSGCGGGQTFLPSPPSTEVSWTRSTPASERIRACRKTPRPAAQVPFAGSPEDKRPKISHSFQAASLNRACWPPPPISEPPPTRSASPSRPAT